MHGRRMQMHGGRKPKNIKRTLTRILSYMLRQKWLLILVAILIVISSGASVAGTYFLKPLINEGIVPLIGKNTQTSDFIPLIKMLIIMVSVYLLGVVATYTYARIMIFVSNKTLNTIRKDLFNHMQDLPIKYFDTHTHGELMSRYTSDVDTLRESLNNGVTQLMTSSITVISTFIMMLVLSPVLTILIIIMIFVMINIIKFIGSRSATYFRNQQKAVGEANGYIEEMIEGQKVVKVFTHEEKVKSEFEVLNNNLRDAATNANIYASVIMPVMGNLSYFNYALTATIGALMTIKGFLDIGTIASFLQYTRSFSQPITQISQQFNSVLAALAGAERIFEIIDETPETDEGKITLENDNNIAVWNTGNNNNGSVRVKGDVEFKNVNFGYEQNHTVLHDLSLHASPGQKIAFVGSTGAGKTTITNLINRFYDIQEGTITYDGIDIKKIKKDDLRRSLAMVLQDTHLFTGTVKENIRYGRLDATDDEIIEAAKLANAHSFIKHLPKGYDTMLVSDGANLSQGQRQLLNIARAAVANPHVLILDEATSSIDTRTEKLIEQGMDKLMQGRTVFIIAHRLSTVRNSDLIMVLEGGKVIEKGNHDELISQKGKYYQLYTGQFELE